MLDQLTARRLILARVVPAWLATAGLYITTGAAYVYKVLPLEVAFGGAALWVVYVLLLGGEAIRLVYIVLSFAGVFGMLHAIVPSGVLAPVVAGASCVVVYFTWDRARRPDG